MTSLARLRIAMLGCFVAILGLALGGIPRNDTAVSSRRVQHFDTTRGQMGLLLRTVEHRRTGLGLMAVGAGILAYALLRRKWH